MADRAPSPELDGLLERIREALTTEPRVLAALVFGSRATGRARPDSDIDVAVLLEPPPRPEERYAVLRTLLSALAGHVPAGDVDLVLLDDAPPVLAFRVLRDGVVALCRDPVALHRLRVRTCRLRADYAHAESIFREATRRRALSGGHLG